MTRLDVIQPDDDLSRRGFITNYPPYRKWRKEAVEGLLAPRPLNLYVHTPYCIQRCAYCHYKTTTLNQNRKAEIDRYVEALCREVELAIERFHLDERPVVSVYFGGGTPTLLSNENLSRIVGLLRERFDMQAPEITVEGEPVTLTERKAALLRELEINRISLGIQSFCDEIVAQTGRRDTEEQALAAIERAKGTGAVVNIDLLSGLAGETMDTWRYTLDRALEVDVHSLTVYKMELYANTQYYAGLRNDEISLPDDDDELRFIRYAIERLQAANYLPVNSFTFGRGGEHGPGHINSVWHGVDNYAFGVSAFGHLGSYSYQNTSDIEKYVSRVEAGELPLQRGYRLTARDLMARDVVLGMKLLTLDRQRFASRYGFDLMGLIPDTLSALEQGEFITVTDERITLSPRGILWGDYVSRKLGTALEQLPSGAAGT